ncbi:MAG: hypothetical protein ABSC23_16105 [Bryobacteraceae bacterium]|jgi:hypothetical protein
MLFRAATPPFRKILDERFSELSRELETLAAAQASETADRLNQAVRRMRQAEGVEELGATLLDAAGAFAESVALFRLDGDVARGEGSRGSPEAAIRGLEVSLAEAPALAGAVESRDPVVTATTPADVSARLVDLWSHPPDGRAFVFPLAARHRVVALLYAWGAVEAPALELAAQVAADRWSGFSPPADLVAIAPAPEMTSAWDRLSAEEQRLHLRAQRFARVRVAEMRLYHAAEVRAGRSRRAVYDALREPIDAARETFRASYFAPCPSMVDYLHLEMVRTLANDDPELLGEIYPGILA